VGACGLAPVVLLDDVLQAKASGEEIVGEIERIIK
jgi:NADH:ubiquinone oxidoreductase subunit E